MNNCIHTSGNSTLLSSSTSSVTGIVFLLLAATIGLPGNLFVIWSILWKMKPTQRSVTCVLVVNLAVADGVVLFLTPFFVVFLIFKNWLFGVAICKGVYYLCCINMFASIFIITLMSIDRCLAVLKEPSRGHYICEPCHARPNLAIFHFTLETVVAFIIPFTIIVGCYSAILIRLRGVKRRRGARTEKLIVAIVICFAVLWVPYHIVNMLQVSSNMASGRTAERLGQAWKSGRAGATALAFLSSSINPVLYVFAAGNLIKTSGANFIAQFFEGASDGLGRRSQSQKNLAKDLVVVAGAAVNMDQQALGHGDGVNEAAVCRPGEGMNEQPLYPG
ncbi:hypothetical protein JRQ81_004314 [Phrynocephalus forsythii]|uniref:G-protein coupled receptors family 1 profile domain-containing protein n=1 Tax=Phrynocephalus forsythii TaxID=171643 RepID=A0A9Q1AUT0_9SAUR|nr:hypothetical protein JRQ81_004314 [Phrynocephalus forsythii]